MFNRLVTSIEPFALSLIILAGASMAGWVSFTNNDIVGIALVLFGSLLIIKHIWMHIEADKNTK